MEDKVPYIPTDMCNGGCVGIYGTRRGIQNNIKNSDFILAKHQQINNNQVLQCNVNVENRECNVHVIKWAWIN